MADLQRNQSGSFHLDQQDRLTRLVEKFICNPDPAWAPLREVLQIISKQSWHACLFGGLMCRLLAHGFNYKPRDVDIVLAGASTGDLQRVFAEYPHSWTRFGGIRVQWKGWTFDLWPLDQTWAFRERVIRPFGSGILYGFDRLPESTFLDIEAVAVELTDDLQKVHQVYEKGFFKAIQSKQVNINLEYNSSPEQAVVRSLILACQLQFTLGPELVHYVALLAQKNKTARLLRIQRSLYGTHPNDGQILENWLSAVIQHQSYSPHSQPGLRLRKEEPWLGKKLVRPERNPETKVVPRKSRTQYR
ncbi:MAG: hypothetical protein ACRYFS_19960 [Janthinobacterium lividum]